MTTTPETRVVHNDVREMLIRTMACAVSKLADGDLLSELADDFLVTANFVMSAPAAPAPEPVAWRPIHSAPEDTHVILATSGGFVGEALMLRDEDTGQKKWTWALGPVHANHVPLGWMPMPSSIDQPVGG